MQTAIVVEGGAMRGVFTAGVLDVFLERELPPFDVALGVSAGACTLVSHLGGQHGRNLRCYLDQLSRREFIDPRRLVTGGHALDLDWLWDTLMKDDPIDADAILSSGTELVFATTCAEQLTPVFVEATHDTLLDGLKASCAVPGLYRGGVEVGGRVLVDGGITAPLPADEAYRRGARRIMVLRTHRAQHSRGAVAELRRRLALRLARTAAAGPLAARTVAAAIRSYARALEFLRHPPADCQVLEVLPPEDLQSTPITQRRAALLGDYALGRAAGLAAIDDWRALDRRDSGVALRGAPPAPSWLRASAREAKRRAWG